MTRLSNTTLAGLPAIIERPHYDRAGITPGIVHLGIGAFHRAHQSAMTEACLNAGARDWGIIAASLRSPETRDALEPQDGLYALGVRDGTGTHLQVIGAVTRVLVAPEDPEALLAAMCAPETRIITITVSEKGYCLDPVTYTLDEKHHGILRDLAAPHRPSTTPGFIAEAIRRRRTAGLPAFTVLCCDNLPANGVTVKRIVARYGALVEPSLGEYIAKEVAFPSTMVDRIVPATTEADRAHVAVALGVEDGWPVMTEPFLQWVIEDNFPLGRPDWGIAGAEFVSDVAPHELMKLRMLNGSHSMLAYCGTLAGLEFVADCAHDKAFARLLAAYWRMTRSTLPPGGGLDPQAYAARLQARYENPAIRHRLIQIAMDGSQKLPQRQLNSLRELRKSGASFAPIALTLAAFIEFMTGRDKAGSAYAINDPMAGEFTARAEAAGNAPEALVPAMLGIAKVFGDLASDDVVRDAVIAGLVTIRRDGIRAAVNAVAGMA